MGTKFEAAARNALAGFVKEWSATDFPPLAEQVAEARRIASPKFQLHLPKDLIGRKEAKALLLKLVAKHDGKLRAQHFNPDRPLAFLCWPQSSIFKEQPELTYSKSQIQAFTSWKSGFEGREKLYLSFYDPTILAGALVPSTPTHGQHGSSPHHSCLPCPGFPTNYSQILQILRSYSCQGRENKAHFAQYLQN
jgi:hypothetical protein